MWKKSNIISSYITKDVIILSWLLFVVLFFASNMAIMYISDHYEHIDSIFFKACSLEVKTILKAIMGWSGIIALYLSAYQYCFKHKISDFVISIGTCGYGVYIFHQFFLKYIYYYTNLPVVIGSINLPWIAWVLTTVISLLLTLAVRKTKIGRKLL